MRPRWWYLWRLRQALGIAVGVVIVIGVMAAFTVPVVRVVAAVILAAWVVLMIVVNAAACVYDAWVARRKRQSQ